jgi:ribokinase
MPRVLNFGSLNIDHVYRVPHFVQPKETLSSLDYQRFAGGKGFNQSIALARAGADVAHAGCIGADGTWLRELLVESGANVAHLRTVATSTGHAIINVSPDGQNSIVLYGGANRAITPDMARDTIATFKPGDFLLLQNEISAMPEIMRLAQKRGMNIVFNPAPLDAAVATYPLETVSCFLLNEIEGSQLSGADKPDAVMTALRKRFPKATIILTLGHDGVLASDAGNEPIRVPACRVEKVVDTTAAGDTFTGYYLAGRLRGDDFATAIRTACRAAAICVTRPGAAASIPKRDEVDAK